MKKSEKAINLKNEPNYLILAEKVFESHRQTLILDTTNFLKSIDTLNKKEYIVISNYFGLYTNKKSLNEIKMMLNLSYERIRQIFKKSIEKIKTRYNFLIGKFDELKSLNLSARSYHALIKANICSYDEFIKLTVQELIEIRGLGTKCIDEICKIRKHLGFPILDYNSNELKSLNLSTRCYHALIKANIYFCDDFSKLTVQEIIKIRGIGTKCIDEICKKREDLGFPILDYNSDELKSLNLSTRSYNALIKAKVYSYNKFTKLTAKEFIKISGLGIKSFNEICKKREDLGFPILDYTSTLKLSRNTYTLLAYVGITSYKSFTQITYEELIKIFDSSESSIKKISSIRKKIGIPLKGSTVKFN